MNKTPEPVFLKIASFCELQDVVKLRVTNRFAHGITKKLFTTVKKATIEILTPIALLAENFPNVTKLCIDTWITTGEYQDIKLNIEELIANDKIFSDGPPRINMPNLVSLKIDRLEYLEFFNCPNLRKLEYKKVNRETFDKIQKLELIDVRGEVNSVRQLTHLPFTGIRTNVEFINVQKTIREKLSTNLVSLDLVIGFRHAADNYRAACEAVELFSVDFPNLRELSLDAVGKQLCFEDIIKRELPITSLQLCNFGMDAGDLRLFKNLKSLHLSRCRLGLQDEKYKSNIETYIIEKPTNVEYHMAALVLMNVKKLVIDCAYFDLSDWHVPNVVDLSITCPDISVYLAQQIPNLNSLTISSACTSTRITVPKEKLSLTGVRVLNLQDIGSSTITDLSMKNCYLKDEDLVHFKRMQLRKIDISGNRIGAAGLNHLKHLDCSIIH